jgi:hypothetical protein
MQKIRLLLEKSMHKGWWLIAGLAAGCASTTDSIVPPTHFEMVSPEADLGAPGMIPVECEQLLQKAGPWGYTPGEKWKPANLEIAREASLFFATFSLVPENTHRYFLAWEQKVNSKTEAEAKNEIDKLALAQVCDPALTMGFMDGVLDFSWPKQERPEAGKNILRFVLNQQARKAFLLPRAVSLHVLEKAKKKGYLSGSAQALKPIKAKVDTAQKKFTVEAPTLLEQEKKLKEELLFSDRIREEMSRFLPLP